MFLFGKYITAGFAASYRLSAISYQLLVENTAPW